MRNAAVILQICFLTCFAAAQDDRIVDVLNHFTYPPAAGPTFARDQTVNWQNLNWTIDQNQVIEWIAKYDFNLYIYRQGTTDRKLLSGYGTRKGLQAYSWDGDLNPLDLSLGKVFYFAAVDPICEPGAGRPGCDPFINFSSHYFNLNNNTTSPPTTPTTVPTPAADTITISSIANDPSSKTPEEPTASPASPTTTISSQPSNLLPLGVGVGGGIGGAIILAVIAILYFQLRKSREQNTQAASLLAQALPAAHQFGQGRQSYGPYAQDLPITSRFTVSSVSEPQAGKGVEYRTVSNASIRPVHPLELSATVD